jgi:hypothetical protein
MSSLIPSSLVAYTNYRLSSPPVHFNQADFRRSAPSAIAAGWMPAPSPPLIHLDLDVHQFPEGTGFRVTDNLIGLFQDHGYVIFTVDPGDWLVTLRCRDLSAPYVDPYAISLTQGGEFLFGLHLLNETLVVITSTNLAPDNKSVLYSYPCTEVNSITLSGPTIAETDILAIYDYTVLVATFPDPPPNFTL